MTNKTLIGYLKKSVFTGSIKVVIVILSTIIFLPLIISKIGMTNYGLISLSMIFGGMTVFVDFGIAKSVTLLIGKLNEKSESGKIISSALIINGFLIFIIGLLLSLLVFFNIPVFGKELQITESLKNFVVLIGFVSIVIILLNNLLTAILEAFYLMHYVNIGFTMSTVLVNIFIYFTSVLTDSIYLLILSPIFAYISVTVYFYIIVIKHTPVRLMRTNILEIKNILSISYKFFNISVVNIIILPINKYFIVYATGNPAALGIFDIALKIVMMANGLLNTVAQPLFGVFSNIRDQKERIFDVSKKITILIFILYIIGVGIYYTIGQEITKYIDEIHYAELYTISLILLIGIGMNGVAEPFYRAWLGTEKLKEAFYVKLIVPIVNVLLILFMWPVQNLEKIVIAYSISIFSSALVIIILSITRQYLGNKR